MVTYLGETPWELWQRDGTALTLSEGFSIFIIHIIAAIRVVIVITIIFFLH